MKQILSWQFELVSSISGKDTDFTGYEIYDADLNVSGPPRQWPRPEAEKNFNYFVDNLDSRISMLNGLTTRNDGPKLDYTDESVAALNEWFVDRAEPDPDQENWPGGLTADWYSVALDMKAYLGQILRQRKPNLRWELCIRSKKEVAYQVPVIIGFTKVPNKNYQIEYGRIIAVLGVRIVEDDLREDSREILLNILRTAVERA